MKKKSTIVVALFVVLMTNFVQASEIAVNGPEGVSVSFKDVLLDSSLENYVGYVGEVVPIRVAFISNVSDENVRIKARIEGSREEVSSSTRRLTLREGGVYTELLNLRLPSYIEDTTEEYILYIEISSATHRTEKAYKILMQRESYDLRILSVDFAQEVSPGNVLPIEVVVKNVGFQRTDDVYLTVAIPEIGVYQRAYLDDLIAVDKCTEDCDRRDSVAKTINLRIPSDAKEGVYELVTTVYNYDIRVSDKRMVRVIGDKRDEGKAIVSVRSQEMKIGETKNYEIALVNNGDKVAIYNISAVANSALELSYPSIVSVGPKDTKTFVLKVKAKENAEEGIYNINVVVNQEQLSLIANVVKDSSKQQISDKTTFAITVVLAVVFVILLVVLVVLLLRKEKKVEEIETSYY